MVWFDFDTGKFLRYLQDLFPKLIYGPVIILYIGHKPGQPAVKSDEERRMYFTALNWMSEYWAHKGKEWSLPP